MSTCSLTLKDDIDIQDSYLQLGDLKTKEIDDAYIDALDKYIGANVIVLEK